MCNFCSITRCYHITTTETTEDELTTPTTVTTTTSVTTPTTVTVTTTPMSTSTLLDSTSLKLEIRTTSKVPHLGNFEICRIRRNVCCLSVVLVLVVGYVFHLYFYTLSSPARDYFIHLVQWNSLLIKTQVHSGSLEHQHSVFTLISCFFSVYTSFYFLNFLHRKLNTMFFNNWLIYFVYLPLWSLNHFHQPYQQL